MAQVITSFIDRIQLGEDEAHQIAIGSSAYGVCNTIENDANKIVNLPGFELNTGTTIHIKFNNANSASNPTLNVNNTGAKSIVKFDNASIDNWVGGVVLTLTYDGTNWIRDQDANTTYTISPSLINGKIKIVSSADENYDVGVTGLAALAYKSELLESDIPNLSWTKITTGIPTTLSGYGITDAFINNNGAITLGSETITPIVSINGYTGSEITITPSDLGLSTAMHFIGVIDSDWEQQHQIENGSYEIPIIVGIDNYEPQDGDVILDSNALREYVYADNQWILLGFTASTIYDSNSITATVNHVPTWISRITQETNGTIIAERQTMGILPITHGGTGVSSFSSNQVILSDNINGTTGLVSRAYTDNSTATALNITNNFITEETVYYGLPIINNTHNYTSNTTIFAPTSSGTQNAILVANGYIPIWTPAATIDSTVSNIIDQASYSTLTLGNNNDISTTLEHSEGILVLYSSATHSHTIMGASTTSNYLHTLPNSNGTLIQMDLTIGTGSNTQPIYISNNGLVAPLTYTANRLYYSASTTSFEATNHYATNNTLGLNITVWPNGNTDTLYVNGTTYLNNDTTLNGILNIANRGVIYGSIQANQDIVSFTQQNGAGSGIIPQFIFNGHISPSITETYDLGTNNNKWNNTYAYNGYYSTELWGDQIQLIDNQINFYSTMNNNTHTCYVHITGSQDRIEIRSDNNSIINEITTIATLNYNGHISPSSNNVYNLGSNENRWAKLYIGNTDSYGDAYTPIYWNNGMPAQITPVQYCSFIIQKNNTGVRLTHSAFTTNSYVLQIVITSGEENLNSVITWESSNEHYIDLNCNVAVSDNVTGYILVSRGEGLGNLTLMNLPLTNSSNT